MQSSDTATGVRVNCLYHIFSQKWNAGNKQTNKICFFNFGEDLSYFLILRYKLRDFIKNLWWLCKWPNEKEIFRRLCYYFISAGIVSWNINGFGCIQNVARFIFYERWPDGIMFDFSQLCSSQIIFIDNGLYLLVVNKLIAESIIL